MEKIDLPKKELHILVCINDRSHLPEPKKPDCGPKISLEEIQKLKLKLKEQGLLSKVKITKTSCLGVCSSKGPAILVYPGQDYYTINSIKDLEEFIIKKVS